MDFPEALRFVLSGYPVTRQAWAGAGQIQAQFPFGPEDKINVPYLYLNTDEARCPYVPNQVDMFAHDWEEAIADVQPSKPLVDPLA